MATSEREQEAVVSTHSGQLTDEDYRRQAEFRYAIRRFSRFAEDQARHAGITPQQHLLLLTVRGHRNYPGVSIKEIAERLQIRHHSASLLVDRGVGHGLLTRSEDTADRRKTLVSLTESGQRILDQITWANRQELRALDDALFGFRDSLIRALGARDEAFGANGILRRPRSDEESRDTG